MRPIQDLVDAVWRIMCNGEFYTVTDLANVSGLREEQVVRILDFLTRYRFVKQISKKQRIYMRIENAAPPAEALRVLQTLLNKA